MNRTKLCLVIFMIIVSFSTGQERRDVVYLKNGDVIKGIIVENVFDGYVRIELVGGSIFSYKYVDIEKITKEPDKTPRTQISNPTSTVTLPQTKSSDVSEAQKTQFSQGTMSIGSLFSYYSFDPGDDYAYEESGKRIGTAPEISFTIKPLFSYFIKPNLSLDGHMGFMSSERDNEGEGVEDYKASSTLIGIGATFYVEGLYGGGGFARTKNNNNYSDASSNYFELHVGVLRKVSENVFLDFGAIYLFGKGDTEGKYNGLFYDVDNEETMFQFNIGIRAFFNPQLNKTHNDIFD